MGKLTRTEKVTPAQYDAIQRTLADPRLGSEEAVIKACEAAGINPPTWYQDVRLEVVDTADEGTKT